MNEELRNILGKTLYNASSDFSDDDTPTWEELSEDTYYPWMCKSAWIARAENAVEIYKTIEQGLSQKILGIAQNALDAGGTWSEADRMGVLFEALEDIIKEVRED